ncbi:MAG TPA: GYD domain-containing protein [Acidimicrobiia bacterium]|nr:GYD domain-containing protein [Acidimicrobiia bacterium]
MPTYLFQSGYTPDGLKGVVREGGSGRRAATQKLVESLGGRLESFYYAFGSDDVIVIAELPDNQTAAALALAVNAEGHIHSRTTVLISPEELDTAAKTTVAFRPPGA